MWHLANQSDERAQDRGKTARRLIGELRPYKRTMLVVLLLVVVSSVMQAIGPWLVGLAIDQHIMRGDLPGLARTMILLFFVYVVGSLATRAQSRRIGFAGQEILASFRSRIFERFQHLPLRYFDSRPAGDLISRVVNDVDTINQLLSQGLTQLLGAMFSLVVILATMLVLNLRLALVSFTIIPVMLLTTSFFSARARRAFRRTRETVSNVTANLQEEIVGVRQAQAFNRTEENIARFRERNAANRDANIQAVGITSAFWPTIDVLSTLATAIVIGYGGYLVFHDELTVGLLAAFLIYVQQFFRPIQLVSQVYTQIQSSMAGAERIYSILDEEPEPPDPPGTPTLSSVRGQVRFDHVTFEYKPGQTVLHDVSFTIEPGQTVALVGHTGAGKTTIANLIPRFYDVAEGAVLVDGHDVRSVTRPSLRKWIALVLQEPFLFGGTVADNIAYGREGATREEVEAAARAVNAHDFISKLPEGYDTNIGERGATLSQGQRQLISFARAVLADPRILILDEATANIDTRTELLIQRALGTLLEGRASLVIAHRLSTVRNADLILVMQNGRIVERGSHHELMERGGLYADLYNRQFRDAPARRRSPSTEAAPNPS